MYVQVVTVGVLDQPAIQNTRTLLRRHVGLGMHAKMQRVEVIGAIAKPVVQ